MNEKSYKRKFEFQKKMIARQSEQIEKLKNEIESLRFECERKDEIINAVEPMRKEMIENIKEHKRLKNEYQKLVNELKQMKNILNKEVFKNRWWLVKFFIK